MLLRPQTVPCVPEETARIARAAFPKGNLYLQLRDEIGVLFDDTDFAYLFPTRGQPANAPWRLALITIFQFIENLSDRAASDAVRARIDWKYALSLELEDSGFDSTVLCEFRARLVIGKAENFVFEKLPTWCRERKMLKARGRQRTDSTHVLACVKEINRFECVLESMRFALERDSKRISRMASPDVSGRMAASLLCAGRYSGIEGTISQAVRGFGIRRSRYIGQAKTHLQQVVSATAINFLRINNWLQEVPVAKTRQPLFSRVMHEKCWQN